LSLQAIEILTGLRWPAFEVYPFHPIRSRILDAPSLHLTDLTVRSLKPPTRGQKDYADDGLPGFAVRVSQGGTKTFTLTYGSPRKRVTLGRFGIITLAQAREKARQLLAHRTLHGDRPPALTFEEALTLFLRVHCAEHNRPSTAMETERLLRRHALPVLGPRTLEEITTGDILRITDGMLGTPSEANHFFTALRTMLRWATTRRYIPHSPMEGLKLPAKASPRSRVLSPDELRLAFTHGAQAGEYGQIIRLLILTGQRLGQIVSLRPEFIVGDTITWPPECMKGNREHTIPLGPLTKAELERFPMPCTFNNWSDAHKAFLKASGLTHFTRHDLRRSWATVMAEWTPPHLLSSLLAHAEAGVLPVYNRYAYRAEKAEAIQRFEAYLRSL
jgi:integrase